MDVDGRTIKCCFFGGWCRGGSVNRRPRANASEDRLSSLPNDIRIRIISLLPFPYVVVTECLSTRWRGLWTHLTSIDITRLQLETSLEFIKYIRHLLSRITSPCLNTFSVELGGVSYFPPGSWPSIDSWIESLTNNRNNVRELKLSRLNCIWGISMPGLQRFILQTQKSLVLLELSRLNNWQSSSNVEFNLPNLRSLILGFDFLNDSEWLNKLIKGCPLLENLDLSCEVSVKSGIYVIQAPKLEYLSVRGNKYSTFCFSSEIPIALRKARIKVSTLYGELSDEENRLWSIFYDSVSNVTVLHLDLLPTPHLSTVFQCASQLTLDIQIPFNVQTVLSFLELCPVLNFLTLRFYPMCRYNEERELPKPDTLQRALQRIHVEIYLDPYYSERYFEVVEYLLSNTIYLAHFKYDLTKSQNRSSNSCVEALQRRELELCWRLYKCPIASTVCEVKFVGKFYKMFQKAGRKASDDPIC